MFEFLQSHPDVRMHDQTTLNACFVNRIRILSSKWMTYDIGNSFNVNDKNVLHFSGGSAPWMIQRGLHSQQWWEAYWCWHSYSKLFFEDSYWGSIRKANSIFRTLLIFFFILMVKCHCYNWIVPYLFCIRKHSFSKMIL